ncbi:hypothetical protein [Haloarcula marismortui]|jgi:hypothetical protein|uniref:DUF8052 domain-containing protein n=1 Tax=Haloarcula marismortui ATCC 33800 TaxID=662476 RepID=M0K0N8_9EURY|nr:hypothetical protein [Haloarcula sinaiiensis]EMA14766.1 hypothetical protein C436_06026 [Haloarcula sinaiiensis ATCC 33800]QUJ71827.1 hypothetical protein KDQ40_14210 [Haloarcula sinaiiensis ATCC 33800]
MSEESESMSGEDPTDYGAESWEDPMTGAVPKSELPDEIVEEVPHWTDDPYFDRVGDRLMYNYTLERDHRLRGERWDLYGEMRVLNQKQFFHPALSYGDHESEEYLYARRVDRPTVGELKRLVKLGHDLADERVSGNEEHYRTDFTFVLVADEIPDEVRSFVEGQRERTLLKYGYYGHYEVNLGVVVPDEQVAVAGEAADVVEAFVLWEDVTQPEEGVLSRLAKRFWK